MYMLQVVKYSDVLFLFGGLAEVRDTIKSIKDDLKDHQIIVPVTKDGNLDVFQVNCLQLVFVNYGCAILSCSAECNIRLQSSAWHKQQELTDRMRDVSGALIDMPLLIVFCMAESLIPLQAVTQQDMQKLSNSSVFACLCPTMLAFWLHCNALHATQYLPCSMYWQACEHVTVHGQQGSEQPKAHQEAAANACNVVVMQTAAGGMARVVQAVAVDELKWQKGVNVVGTHVSLRKGSSVADLDGEIVKTLFEAAGYPVDEDTRSAMTAGG